jgi:hypothetical protein
MSAFEEEAQDGCERELPAQNIPADEELMQSALATVHRMFLAVLHGVPPSNESEQKCVMLRKKALPESTATDAGASDGLDQCSLETFTETETKMGTAESVEVGDILLPNKHLPTFPACIVRERLEDGDLIVEYMGKPWHTRLFKSTGILKWFERIGNVNDPL